MKLVRYGLPGEEKPGIVDETGNIYDISSYLPDITPIYLTTNNLQKLVSLSTTILPIAAHVNHVRIGPCVNQAGKLICVGFNSKQHIQEMGQPTPTNVIFFLKATSSIIGPNDTVLYSPLNQKVDWEAELALVISKKGKNIAVTDAKDYILGYTCMNDLSDRYWQFDKGGQHAMGKSFDTFAPLGPYLVTPDEVGDITRLQISCSVNQEKRQSFQPDDYIFKPYDVISELSKVFTLFPGDVISLGTGPGNAKAWGNAFLTPGDVLNMQIHKLGAQENKIVAAS